MHELKLIEVQKEYRDKKAIKKWSGKNNINEADLWNFAGNRRKDLL